MKPDTVNVLREQIAEIIDPEAFVPMECIIGMGKAFIKADTILAMLAAAPKAEPVSGDWYSAESIDALVREIDVALNGANAAPQAKLCDLVKQIKELAQPEAPKVEQEHLNPTELAMLFHEAYERLAPSFGYETRDDTKSLDLNSPNGKLMVAVCTEIAGHFSHPAPASDELLEEERELDASDYDAIDRSLKYVGTVFAMHDLHEALTETMVRMHSGYDWNADPDGITLKQGDAIRRYDTLKAKHKGPQS